MQISDHVLCRAKLQQPKSDLMEDFETSDCRVAVPEELMLADFDPSEPFDLFDPHEATLGLFARADFSKVFIVIL